jgi:hypothetical protein
MGRIVVRSAKHARVLMALRGPDVPSGFQRALAGRINTIDHCVLAWFRRYGHRRSNSQTNSECVSNHILTVSIEYSRLCC